MRTTIDSAGRLVIPKPLRDSLGVGPGHALELEVVDGRLVIEPAATPMRLAGEGRRVHAVTDTDVPTMTAEEVRAALERIRR